MHKKPTLPASLHGTTARFKGNGRKLGYPTANIRVETDLEDGIYFGYAHMLEFINQPALIFIGTPTTVGDTERRVEAHLLYVPDKDYYDQPILLDLRVYHRQNETFKSIDELLRVMKKDETAAREWFVEQAQLEEEDE